MSVSFSVDLSIIVVTFNNAPEISDCLTAIRLAAAGSRYEILVIDNASSDGTVEVLAAEHEVKVIASPVNLGFAGGNNRALAAAGGKYLALVNPDALPAAGSLASAVDWMDQHPAAGLAGGRLIGQDGTDQPSARSEPSCLNDFLMLSGLAARFPHSRFFGRADRTWANPDIPSVVDWVPGAFAIVRRSAVENDHLFDSRFFLYFEEVDLCRRLRKRGYSIWYQPEWRAVHIGGVSSQRVEGEHFSNQGSQLSLWRIRSKLLYYRKYHGLSGAFAALWLERGWHWLRFWRNRLQSRPGGEDRCAESRALLQLLLRAWRDTAGGKYSPPQPW